MDRKTIFALLLAAAFTFAMVMFRHELTLLGFYSLVISITANIVLIYKYLEAKESGDRKKQ